MLVFVVADTNARSLGHIPFELALCPVFFSNAVERSYVVLLRSDLRNVIIMLPTRIHDRQCLCLCRAMKQCIAVRLLLLPMVMVVTVVAE